MAQVWVNIPVASTWPTKEDLTSRDAVINALDQSEIGVCTGSGGGRGSMDFSYRVSDGSKARSLIEQAMTEHMPGKAFTVKVLES